MKRITASYLSITIPVCLCLAAGTAVHLDCRLLHPALQCGDFPASHPTGLNVVILGDSWAAHAQLAESLRSELGAGATVRRDAFPGETTKDVFIDSFGENGCKNPRAPLSDVRYAVLVVGVNDAVGHRGADFYSHHLALLVTGLRARHVQPVIVLLPRVGTTKDAIRSELWYRSAKHALFELAMDKAESDTIDRYRREFLSQPEARNAILVDPDQAIGRYSPGSRLWHNPSHLSLDGDNSLGSAIGQAILHDVHAEHQN
jgi:hypothetical protein